MVGINEIYPDSHQIPFFEGTVYEKMNYIQRELVRKTKINIGFHTLVQGDTLFLIYWITSYYNMSQISLAHFLLWSIIRNIILFKSYWIKIKDQ